MVSMTAYMTQHKPEHEQKRRLGDWAIGKAPRQFLLVLMVLFALGYVIQTSAVSTKGYDISDLQKHVRTMRQEEQTLELQIAEYRSMASIQERLKAMNLVAAGDVQYVSEAGAVVARR